MTVRPAYLAGLLLVAAGLLVAVSSLQLLTHVGSCGSSPNGMTYGSGPCPDWITLKILGGVAGLLVAIITASMLGGVATPLCFGLGFTMLGTMFTVLGLVPAPGDQPTYLGLAIGAPFLLGGLIGFAFAVRAFLWHRSPARVR
jgi:hypothetical protein